MRRKKVDERQTGAKDQSAEMISFDKLRQKIDNVVNQIQSEGVHGYPLSSFLSVAYVFFIRGFRARSVFRPLCLQPQGSSSWRALSCPVCL